MNAPRIKNEITVGSLASLVGLLLTILGVVAALTNVGVAIGSAQTDIAALKAGQVQSSADSRALIRLQADMDYLKAGLDELRGRGRE